MKNISLIRRIRKAVTGSYFTSREQNEATRFAYAELGEAQLWAGTKRVRKTDAFVISNWEANTFNVVIDHVLQKKLVNA